MFGDTVKQWGAESGASLIRHWEPSWQGCLPVTGPLSPSTSKSKPQMHTSVTQATYRESCIVDLGGIERERDRETMQGIKMYYISIQLKIVNN